VNETFKDKFELKTNCKKTCSNWLIIHIIILQQFRYGML